MSASSRAPVRVLVLDDDTDRVDYFRIGLNRAHMLHVPSAAAAIHQIKFRTWDVVFLDHDLEESIFNYGIIDHGCGMDVVDALVNKLRRDGALLGTLFVVHSINERRGTLMVDRLRAAGYRASRRTYAWMDIRDLTTLADGGGWDAATERWSVHFPPERLTPKRTLAKH